jgi:hypothetical protein
MPTSWMQVHEQRSGCNPVLPQLFDFSRRLDCQRKPLMRTDVKRREIWEWSDHTLIGSANSIQINTSLLMT